MNRLRPTVLITAAAAIAAMLGGPQAASAQPQVPAPQAAPAPQTVPAPRPWPQQPAEVMGIRLGAPLESAGIPPCDASNEVRGRLTTMALCFQPRAARGQPERTYYTVHNAPDLGAGEQDVVLDVAWGQVAGVLLTGPAMRFDKMLSVLETRYGRAMETATGTARTPAGTALPTVSKRWRGERVTIEATSPFGHTDEYAVYWLDQSMQARRDALNARESAGKAGKL